MRLQDRLKGSREALWGHVIAPGTRAGDRGGRGALEELREVTPGSHAEGGGGGV